MKYLKLILIVIFIIDCISIVFNFYGKNTTTVLLNSISALVCAAAYFNAERM